MLHEQEYRIINEWGNKLLESPDWLEVENRPWANENVRWNISHCIGHDFYFHDPRVTTRFFWNEKEQLLQGIVQWTDRAEGPPMCSHGASIMTVFDEILAYPVWRTGKAAFTANVNINLRKTVPLAITAKFEAQVTKSEGRKRFVKGVITNSQGIPYADATGLWITSDGIGRSMAVYDNVIAADEARMKKGEKALEHVFMPPATQLASLPDNYDLQASDNGLEQQYFVTKAHPRL